MFELLLKLLEGVEPDEIELDDVEMTFLPVPADKADDDLYSSRMCAQPVELMFDVMSEIFDPKRKRRRVKKRPLVAHRVLPAMSRSREHRAAPRREGGARADSSDDPGGGEPRPPPRSGGVRVLECGRKS